VLFSLICLKYEDATPPPLLSLSLCLSLWMTSVGVEVTHYCHVGVSLCFSTGSIYGVSALCLLLLHPLTDCSLYRYEMIFVSSN
jgi:hypothetical protein